MLQKDIGRCSQESFFIDSQYLFSKSTQIPQSRLKSIKKNNALQQKSKILPSSILKVRMTQQIDLGIHSINTPLINIKRKHKIGKLKQLIQVNEQSKKIKYQDMAVNITKLTSPFLIDFLNKGITKKSQNNLKSTSIRFSQSASTKKRTQKSLKELYQKQYYKNKSLYQVPLSQSMIQKSNFLNIQRIKPLNPEQLGRRRSVMSVGRKTFDNIEVKIKRKSDDIGFRSKQEIKKLKEKSFNKSTKYFAKSKQFKPICEKYYYRDFIWKIAFCHSFSIQIPIELPRQYRAFIGNGNNKLLIKSLLKHRSWWTIVDKYDDSCHFSWTQIKLPQIFKAQSKHPKKQIEFSQKSLNQEHKHKIFAQQQQQKWRHYFKSKRSMQQKSNDQMLFRNKYFSQLDKLVSTNFKVHNHLQNNYIIGNKKALFKTMSQFYELSGENVFDYLPMTFHIESGTDDPEYTKFLNYFYEKARRVKRIKTQESNHSSNSKNKIIATNAWIVKPGEFTNRGNGIKVCLTLDQIKTIIRTKQKHANGNSKTYIVQTYLDKPFLYHKRKFDIRHYMMISSLNGIIRGYWYEQGYLRTTSFEYNLSSCSSGIHLTNDAIQKYLPQYGKYQKGNKLSYIEFEQYLQKYYGSRYSFYKDAYPRMKKIATDAIRASYLFIDREKREHNFQIFGMDFMIDQNFQPWLIEINTNPCLQLSCPLLARLIPQMVQNSLLIGLDPLFPPPAITINKGKSFKQNSSQLNRFHLVFDSNRDGKHIQNLYSNHQIKDNIEVSQDDEVYDDDGKQLQ